MEPRLIDIIDNLTSVTGVYYMYKSDGELIYIGKSKNIKNRVNQHFTGTTPKSKKMQTQVAAVKYEATGSELVALLKESEEIKRNKPILNRALRRSIFTHALYSFIDDNGYINLTIDKADGRKPCITTFSTRQSGRHFLEKMVEQFNLCQKLSGIYKTKTSCFHYEVKTCAGACIQQESPEDYNKRVQELLDKYSYKNKNMVIIDRGREVDERSAILIQNGIFKGFGFYNLNYQINNLDILESIITPMENNRDQQHIIQSYLRKNKRIKIIDL
jgi:DNA polymerase-3 subunit epsilon